MTAARVVDALREAGRPLRFDELVEAAGGDWRATQAELLEAIRAGLVAARPGDHPRRPVYVLALGEEPLGALRAWA